MIRALRLENFKCFSSLRLELAPLTILSGFNAAGKSTTLQTLLLLAQTLRGHYGISELALNGPLASLGVASDVLNTSSGTNQLSLGLTAADGTELLWRFSPNERRRLQVSRFEWGFGGKPTIVEGTDLAGLRITGAPLQVQAALTAVERLVYLSAARQVETEVFPTPFDSRLSRGDVGTVGQYAAWWLDQEGDNEVEGNRCVGPKERSTIRNEVNAWADMLFPGVKANALAVPDTSLLRLQFQTSLTSGYSRPANVGYGISYALPILVAGLCATEGQPVLLDSPEAHLHPKGQSGIGRFMAKMAAAGSQILVETHSDHVLNGVRLALQEKAIGPEDVAIYFFTARADSPVIQLDVDKNGNISDWPEGFFDQSEKDLAKLAGWE